MCIGKGSQPRARRWFGQHFIAAAAAESSTPAGSSLGMGGYIQLIVARHGLLQHVQDAAVGFAVFISKSIQREYRSNYREHTMDTHLACHRYHTLLSEI